MVVVVEVVCAFVCVLYGVCGEVVLLKLRCLCLEATRFFGKTPARRPIQVSVRRRGAVKVPKNAVKGA